MIKLEGIKKIYKTKNGTAVAVDDVSLQIKEGEIYGIVGYSGAGKSTLLRCINLLEKPTEGTVQVDGISLTELPTKELRKARQSIGMIFQGFHLASSKTAAENIAFSLKVAGVPKEERKSRVKELLNLVGLSDKADNYPAQLSGGQKQRVGIARALANNPKVLLCDEATSALDPETTNSILDLLVDINRKFGLTIILITHEMHVIRKICERVAVMDKGKIVEQGNVFDVFANPQKAVTKKFVEQVMTDPEEESLEDILHHVESKGKVLRLHFSGSFTNEALISKVSKTFNVSINILQGKITQTQNGVLCTLTIQITGKSQEITKAETFITEANVEVEVIRDDT